MSLDKAIIHKKEHRSPGEIVEASIKPVAIMGGAIGVRVIVYIPRIRSWTLLRSR